MNTKNTLNRREASGCTTLNGEPILIVDNFYLEEMAEMVSRCFSVTRAVAINAIVNKTKYNNLEALQQWNINDIDESTPNDIIIEGALECFDAWCMPGADDMNNNTKFNGITYLTELIEETIDLYAHKFKKTERPKIERILNYYNLELDSDVEYKLEINKWGNRELKLRWYLSPTFNPLHEDWGPNCNPTIYTITTISY